MQDQLPRFHLKLHLPHQYLIQFMQIRPRNSISLREGRQVEVTAQSVHHQHKKKLEGRQAASESIV